MTATLISPEMTMVEFWKPDSNEQLRKVSLIFEASENNGKLGDVIR